MSLAILDNIVETKIHGATFDDIFAQCPPRVAAPDLLVIDAVREGVRGVGSARACVCVHVRVF